MLLIRFFLVVLFLHASPIVAELTQAWTQNIATDSEAVLRIRAVAWNETANELTVLLRTAVGGARPAMRYTIWRIDPSGERVDERPIPEPLRGTSIRGLVVEAGGLTLVSASDDHFELAEVGRDGELKSQRALSNDIFDLDPIETLLLADGTVVLGGVIDEAMVVMARPDRSAPSVTTIPTEGFGAVLDIAPARGGKVLALVHGREQIEAMHVFARGEVHVKLLDRDGGIVRDVRLEGRLGSLLDTGDSYVVLLDLGARLVQDWWLLRFDDDLREVARLRVVKTESSDVPRRSQLLAWPGSGFVAVLAGSQGRPLVARFSPQGTIRSVHEAPLSPAGSGYPHVVSVVGGDALYMVASTYERVGRVRHDVVRVFKLVDN
jgi:hypothetical protein